MNKEEYISLAKASEICDYSQEYLSLRARQNKLKAVKFGRNWVTKKEWLDDYLAENSKNQKIKSEPIHQNFSQRKEILSTEPKAPKIDFSELRYFMRYALPVVMILCLSGTSIIFGENIVSLTSKMNLHPIQDFKDTIAFVASIEIPEVDIPEIEMPKVKKPELKIPKIEIPPIKPVLVEAIGGTIVRSKGNLQNYLADTSAEANQILKYGVNVFQKFSSWCGSRIVAIGKTIVEIPSKISRTFNKAGVLVKNKLGDVYDFFFPFSRQKIAVKSEPEEILISDSNQEGIIVIPSTEDNEKMEEKIKESFSDEVRVKPEDQDSGIIIPIFKEKEGDEYLYILVPIEN